MKKLIALLLVAATIAGMSVMLCGCQQPEDKAKVYYLNPYPEADDTWQALAAQYTEDTGVEVKVVTAASGSYQEILSEELQKDEPPTLFQCDTKQDLETWSDYCLDLTDTDVLAAMTTEEFNLTDDDGAVKAIALYYEAFGIIVNTDLLDQAGYEIEEITDFSSLKTIVEDIHSRAEELGFDAFAPMGLDVDFAYTFSGKLANIPTYFRLANIPLYYEFRDRQITEQPSAIEGTYLSAYKNIWDLYLNNCSPVDAEQRTIGTSTVPNAFAEGKAVFWHQGTWAYKNLEETLDTDDLRMIPIYCGVDGEENAALCCDSESRLAVNAKAKDKDIQATLDFLEWVASADVSTSMLAQQFGSLPFKATKEPDNVFCADANRLITEGKYIVTWNLQHAPETEQWKLGIASALIDYSAGNGEWSAVETAFVDGWAMQYEKQE